MGCTYIHIYLLICEQILAWSDIVDKNLEYFLEMNNNKLYDYQNNLRLNLFD